MGSPAARQPADSSLARSASHACPTDIFKFATATLPANLQSSLQGHDLVESIGA